MASNVFRGRPIGVEIDGTAICITGWNLRREAAELDVTNSCSEGDEDEFIGGSKTRSGTFKGFWTEDQNLHSDPPNINDGETVNAKFLFRKTDPIFYQTDIFISSVETTAEIKGQIDFVVTWRGTGALTDPVF